MSCPEQTNVLVTPGPRGATGTDGTDGTDGVNAYTLTTASFVMPAELATVSVSVGSTAWMVVGQKVYVKNAGYMGVQTITDDTTVVLTNQEDTALGLYNENVAPGTTVATSSGVCAAGIQGPSGTLSGAASGDLGGNYPNPTVEICNNKGDISAHNGTVNVAQGAGSDNTVLHADSAQPSGLRYGGIDLTGVSSVVSGALPLANGGTGQITATAAFDALSPLTTQGDVLVGGASGTGTRVPIGANGTVLASNGTTASFQAISGLISMLGLTFVEDTTIITGASITEVATESSMGMIWAYNSAASITGVKLPDASDFIHSSTAKFFVLLQLGTGGITIASQDAAANTVNNNTGTASAWEGVVYLPISYSGGTEWFRVTTMPA